MDTTAHPTPAPLSIPTADLATRTPDQLGIFPLSDDGRHGRTVPETTIYFPRKHDAELEPVIAAAAGGASRMAILVGDPATGKKRALWEAIRANDDGSFLLRHWKIWPGLSPCTPEELLANESGLSPRTVVWLPAAERCLLSGDSELDDRVARCLRNLLGDETRAPCLILITLTRESWKTLNAPSGRTPPGLHRPNVQLLPRQGTVIRVDESFTKTELGKARDSPEPRLAEAAASAPDGRVIQTLVAEPELRARYRDAGPESRALLDFLIAALHAGHGRWFPRDVLRQGAQAFLGSRAPDSAEWFAEALSEVTEQVPGGAAILIRKSGETADSYCLAPSLERHFVTGAAKLVLPNELVWPVLRERADPENCRALAKECEKRHLLELSAHFFSRAAENGCPRARAELAAMLARAGRIDDAISQYETIARTSVDPDRVEDAVREGARILFAAKRPKDVLDWLGPLAAEGNRSAEVLVAVAHTQLKRPRKALAIHQRLAEKGDLHSAAVVAEGIASREDSPRQRPRRVPLTPKERAEDRQCRQAQLDEAVSYLSELGERTGLDLLPMITDLTVDAAGPEAAVRMLSAKATEHGRHDAYLLGAQVLASAGQVEDALDWVATARQYDVPGAMAAAVRVNLSTDLMTAQRLALACAADGDAAPLIAVGDAFSASDRPRKALDCYYEAAEHEPRALGAAALAAARHGLFDDAAGCYRTAQRAGGAPDPAEIALLLCRFGEARKTSDSEYSEPIAQALKWYVGTAPLVAGALAPVARYIADVYAKDLVTAYRTREDVSWNHALLWVADALVDADSVRTDGTDRATVSGSGVELASSTLLVVASGLYSEAATAGSVLARERAVRLLIKRQSFAEAARLLDSTSTCPARLPGLRAEALAGLGDLAEAERMIEQQIADDDFSSAAGVARGFLLHGRLDTAPENRDKARKNRDKAWELAERGVRGGDIECHVLLADLRRNAGQPGRVLDLYCTALAYGHPRARRRIEHYLASSESPDWNHKQFRKYGLDPRGEIAGGWSVPDSREAGR
ncbi:hypothetical protein SAMN05421854_103298 [Amycolatopsis rubida]|uniref:Tetratricopeptide repeat protein n=1 Tax=Amycolatopsis rubida TaxID=112413 RepID=A0A1I5KRF7_9PSEU|nr:hypothetical protein SAMN05421854_103298 [Amycolatopsis rubida]